MRQQNVSRTNFFIMEKFEHLGLNAQILQSLEKIGFHTPTPIQSQVIPFLLDSDRNLIAKAQTGTGKTAAFGLPIIQNIDVKNKSTQALILSPTRELAMQIAEDLQNFSANTKGLKTVVVYGGSNIDTQIKKLGKGSHIVVGTPGRTLDLIKRKKLKVNDIKYLVLDEADEMLNMGFKEDLDAILKNTPDDKQNLLFSATMPRSIRSIANKYFSDAHEISVKSKVQTAENIDHQYYLVRESDRYATLKRIADYYPGIYGIIFCRTRRETQEVADKLIRDGYAADALHGDLSQMQRDYVMKRFRNRQIQLLVATDVAARGLDVQDLTHIINYNLPDDNEVYIHRSGRTARAGKQGISIAILTPMEATKIYAIEQSAKIHFREMTVPSAEEIFERQLLNILDRINSTEAESEIIEQLLPKAEEILQDLSRQDLIRKILASELVKLEKYYRNAKEIDKPSKASFRKLSREKGGKKGKRRDGTRYTRYFINVGRKDNIEKYELIQLISKQLRDRNIRIGKVDLFHSFSFFEIDSAYASKAERAFAKARYNGRPLEISPEKRKK